MELPCDCRAENPTADVASPTASEASLSVVFETRPCRHVLNYVKIDDVSAYGVEHSMARALIMSELIAAPDPTARRCAVPHGNVMVLIG